MKQRRRLLFLLISVVVPMLASCLSVEAEFDLRRDDRLSLTMVYRMSTALWELGVFDEGSQERAVPVSRRDAEETALRYEGVTLEEHAVTDDGETVAVTVKYQARTRDSLRKLWGSAGGSPLIFAEGSRSITIPLASGDSSMDREQRNLVRQVLADQTARVMVITPDPVRSAETTGGLQDGGDQHLQDNRFSVTVPLARLVTADQPGEIVLEW